MGFLLVSTTMLSCNKGAAPTPLNILPKNMISFNGIPVANVADNIPFMNIMPFSLCFSPSNPSFIPIVGFGTCVPMLPGPWSPGSPKLIIKGQPCATMDSKLKCAFGGEIKPLAPVQTKVKTG